MKVNAANARPAATRLNRGGIRSPAIAAMVKQTNAKIQKIRSRFTAGSLSASGLLLRVFPDLASGKPGSARNSGFAVLGGPFSRGPVVQVRAQTFRVLGKVFT